jgi:hypothetical protein
MKARRPESTPVPDQAETALLGNTTRKVDTDAAEAAKERRRQRYRLQEAAAELRPEERRLRACCKVIPWHRELLEIRKTAEGDARYAGLVRCGSWVQCPICASGICAARAVELSLGVATWLAGGGSVWLLTLTARHGRDDDLRAWLGCFTAAEKRMKQGRIWRRLHEDNILAGTVRALEVTHGFQSGWHPHVHLLLFCCPLPDELLLIRLGCLSTSWRQALASERLECAEVGFDLRPGEAAASYVNKWGLTHEMTLGHTAKRGRGQNRTPWGLLSDLVEARDRHAGALFCIFAQVFKGRRQLFWSHGLKNRLGLVHPQSDEDEAETTIAELERRGWGAVVGARMRAQLLEIAACGGADAVAAFVADLLDQRRAVGPRRWPGSRDL